MSKIISIGTALPAYKHKQQDILNFMEMVYALDPAENRKLKFLYHHSGIDYRYSVIPDYSRDINQWKFYPQSENIEPFPALEQRMTWFSKYAAPLSITAIRNCISDLISTKDITHLITVSCTGMSAPGLELQIMELTDLPKNIYRTSVNFMGCYAAIHAMKIADAICYKEQHAKVMVVCTELCTLHFQKENTMDSIASSLLFGDGAAAVLITGDDNNEFDASSHNQVRIDQFYSEIIPQGKKDMSWELSSTGFLMTLSGYVPELIGQDFDPIVNRALEKIQITKHNIAHWCIHPGGKRILDAIHKSLQLKNGELAPCYEVLKKHGNMSSATILFVLKKIMESQPEKKQKIFAAAFGPGLSLETFTATTC